jgi:C-3',4' desaturase CrtD
VKKGTCQILQIIVFYIHNFQHIVKVMKEGAMYDAAIIGGGISGMATAARLQAKGLRTIVLEAHGRPGGCAGYFCRKGFAFDVGATTLVDFEPGGVGGELLDSIYLRLPDSEQLPGYVAWLPDRKVTLHRDQLQWGYERLTALGNSPAHHQFWNLMDKLAGAFWNASRKGARLPLRNPADVLHNLRALGLNNLPLGRYLRWTMGDALRAFGLRDDQPLCALLAMLIEDTVHSTLDTAPLVNAALGITIRGAGLTRHKGGMMGFWKRFVAHYRSLGGELRTGTRVEFVSGRQGAFSILTARGTFEAAQVVSAVPAQVTAQIAPTFMAKSLRSYLRRDEQARGSAIVVFLGVPESEVSSQAFTHHQLFQDYRQPLGNGNNMFVSVSSPGDTQSAPPGFRAVMISTHCDLEAWQGLSPAEYEAQKQAIAKLLLAYARRVYPNLGEQAVVCETGTPRTYEHFTGRPQGAVGGVRQTLRNSNQNTIPHDVGPAGFWMVGDSTWPGLGTVACVLGSKIVAEGVIRTASRLRSASTVLHRSPGYES